jgi:lipopolysaccharide transport system permease protein
MMSVISDFGAGLSHWRTSYKLGLQDIEMRYKRSLLGPFWITAALVATVLALSYVFASVFQAEFFTFVSFVAAGLLTWQLIVTLVNEGSSAVTEHGNYLKNVPMPMTVIAGRLLFRNTIVFAHNYVAITGLLLIFGAPFSWSMLQALWGVLVILVLGFFLSLVLGPLCARFRDIPLVVQSAMQVLFYITPIFWMPSAMSHRPGFIEYNPFYHLVELVRAPLLGGAPTPQNWQWALGFCFAAAIAAMVSISLTRKRLSLWL